MSHDHALEKVKTVSIILSIITHVTINFNSLCLQGWAVGEGFFLLPFASRK